MQMGEPDQTLKYFILTDLPPQVLNIIPKAPDLSSYFISEDQRDRGTELADPDVAICQDLVSLSIFKLIKEGGPLQSFLKL